MGRSYMTVKGDEHAVLHTLLLFVYFASDSEDQEDKSVLHASLIRLDSRRWNCSVRTTKKKYPLKYPNGAGSSYQNVVGCSPTEQNDQQLWQILVQSIDDYWDLAVFDPNFIFP